MKLSKLLIQLLSMILLICCSSRSYAHEVQYSAVDSGKVQKFCTWGLCGFGFDSGGIDVWSGKSGNPTRGLLMFEYDRLFYVHPEYKIKSISLFIKITDTSSTGRFQFKDLTEEFWGNLYNDPLSHDSYQPLSSWSGGTGSNVWHDFDSGTILCDNADGFNSTGYEEIQLSTTMAFIGGLNMSRIIIGIQELDDDDDEVIISGTDFSSSWLTIEYEKVACGAPSNITVPPRDNDGNYTIKWSSSSTSGATYVLQEATNSSFTVGLRLAYSGSDREASISDRSNGTYYYRVMATRTGYDDSSWENESDGCTVSIPHNLKAQIETSATSVNTNTKVSLTGSAYYQSDNKINAQYKWELFKPGTSSILLENTTNSLTSFTPDMPGTYTVKLIVTDNNNTTATDLKIIKVTKVYSDDELVVLEKNKIYIENVSVPPCELDNIKYVTVPDGEVWKKIKFAYSAPSDLIILARKDEYAEIRSGYENFCSNNKKPNFRANFEHDYHGDGGIGKWDRTFHSGEKIYISLFSMEGFSSSYGINGEVEIIKDRDGDLVPDDKDDFPDDATKQYDSDNDGIDDDADDYPNDPYNNIPTTPCTCSISPSSGSYSSSGGTNAVSVTAPNSNCTWTASESLDWVSLSSTGGTGNQTITITVTANTGAARTGSITLAGKTYAIRQAEFVQSTTALQGFDKTYYLNSKLAQLRAIDAATWNSYTPAGLETLLSGYGLTAESHYMAYGWTEGLSPNASFDQGQYVYGKAAQMFQAGGYGSISDAITAFKTAWPYDAYQHYLLYGVAEGVKPLGNFDEDAYLTDKLADLAAADPSGWAGRDIAYLRTALASAGMTPLRHYLAYGELEGNRGPYPIASGGCTYSISPSSGSFSSSGGTITILVTTSNSNCSWMAAENLSWVSLSGTGGKGIGTVAITVIPNSGVARTGSVTIAGKTCTISQAAVATPCTYSISPASGSFSSSGGTSSVAITASSSSCAWTASESLDWVSLSSTGGTGSKTVTITATANTGAARSGSITIAGKTYAISQTPSQWILSNAALDQNGTVTMKAIRNRTEYAYKQMTWDGLSDIHMSVDIKTTSGFSYAEYILFGIFPDDIFEAWNWDREPIRCFHFGYADGQSGMKAKFSTSDYGNAGINPPTNEWYTYSMDYDYSEQELTVIFKNSTGAIVFEKLYQNILFDFIKPERVIGFFSHGMNSNYGNPSETIEIRNLVFNTNGEIDSPNLNTYYRDYDNDGYGDSNNSIETSSQPSGYVKNNTDCNDTNGDINPGNKEVCNDGIDNNCNNSIDENCPITDCCSSDLIGNWQVTITGTSYDTSNYYISVVLNGNGSFNYTEYLAGSIYASGSGSWTYDSSNGYFRAIDGEDLCAGNITSNQELTSFSVPGVFYGSSGVYNWGKK
jgi:hypothetical protein